MRHALRLQDGVDPRADLRHLCQPEPVDVVAGHLGRSRGGRRSGVVGLAVRQPPDARVMDRATAQFGDERALPVERGEDPLGHQPCDRLGALKRQVGGLQLGGQINRRAGLFGRLVADRRQLFQRGVEDIVGGEDALGRILALALGLGIDGRTERLDPRDIGVGIGGIGDAVLAAQEIGHVPVSPRQLAEHIGGIAARACPIGKALARDHPVEAVGEDVVIQPRPLPQRVARDGGELRPFLPGARELAHFARPRRIAQPRLQAGARAGVEAQRGCQLRAVLQPRIEEAVQHRPQLRITRPFPWGNLGPGGRGGGRRDKAGGGEELATLHEHSRIILSWRVRLSR